ncbi:hexosaminidase D-like, partial [Penaeus monodon]|uniref:hexosaminidase D-like n=1 Tax=Penaeus monodon TaxID=6687 RepID=UPI0018A71E4C
MVSCGRRRLMLAVALLCVLVVLKLWFVADPNPNASPVFVVTPRRGQGGRTHAASKELQTQTGMEVPPERLWHLDLKGGAPLVPFIEGMMSLAARAGATGVLLDLKDVARIMQAAKGAGLSVIHLVQSLGHMEYALKQQRWADLREGESPGEACPTNPGTARLVLEAVDQIMTAAPSHFLHIGADEVFTLAQCQRCRSKGVAPLQLYVDHVAQVARTAKARWGRQSVDLGTTCLRHASSSMAGVAW